MSSPSADIRLRKKAVLLVAEMADWQLENPDSKRPSLFRSCQLLKSVVDLTSSADLDLQEKVILSFFVFLLLEMGFVSHSYDLKMAASIMFPHVCDSRHCLPLEAF